MTPAAALVPLVPSAHGIGGQRDLPISLGLAVAGAVAALVISFAVLALAWRTPRYDRGTKGRPAWPWLDAFVHSTAALVVARTFGMLAFLYTAFVAVFGRDTTINPFFGIFFVILWVGIVPASFLLGPFWKMISPVRTINWIFATLTRGDPRVGVYTYPERLGTWPAALGLFAFVWLELVYPYAYELGPLRLWCVIYVVIMFVGGALFGDRFYESCDPFEVYSSLVGKLSIWTEREGRLYVLSPLANLSSIRTAPGLVAVMAVLFGSTGFDSFKDSSRWITYVQSSSIPGHLLSNVALLVFILVAGLVFSVATMLTGIHPELGVPVAASSATRAGPDAGTTTLTKPGPPAAEPVSGLAAQVRARVHLPATFAHSIVPIVLGYIIAHYMSFAFDVGSRTLILMSDPLSNGSNVLGTADWAEFTFWSYHPQALAVTKVLAVVVGHVVAAVAAHDRAITILPDRHQLTGQLPLLIAMIAFTCVGLYLLFAA